MCCQELVDFLNLSWTPFEAVAEASRRLQAAGFEHINEKAQWSIKVRQQRSERHSQRALGCA
jgi:aspartyl aminopeptidase